MLQPVNLQLAHFNIEHSAQISKDAIAAAQQTAQGQETVQESVRRTQRVEAGMAAAEAQKVKRKEEDQKERRQREKQGEKRQSKEQDALNISEGVSDRAVGISEGSGMVVQTGQKNSPKGFDFYA
ncbi:MAG: hypothetical protein LBP21_03865 [Synergistaceae bacterium]|jgi:hypothetical protein|nr:hypothetical protein [Synergistaceae bacterium]